MIEIQMTPEQYLKARSAIRGAAEIRSFAEVGANAGTLSTSQVSMTYEYDGATRLSVNVTARYGMAKFASESTIAKRLQVLLAQV